MSTSPSYRELAEFYDAIYHWKDYRAEAAQISAKLEQLGVAAGASVLEAACGTGAHLAHLRDTYAVAGFDVSEEMIAVARRKLPGVELFVADMAELETDRVYDALICLYSSIGYVHPLERLEKTAAAFARALRPGGVAVIEPWFTEANFQSAQPLLNIHETADLKLARGAVPTKVGDMSVVDMHWLVMRRGAPAAEHFIDHHELWMCPTEILVSTFAEHGFDARFEPEGISPNRGLLVARRI